MEKGRLRYALPRGESYLRIVLSNIYRNLRNGNAATIRQSPLMQRAYTIVNEVGVLPYQDYNMEVEFKEEPTLNGK
jgi:hypothetical protein